MKVKIDSIRYEPTVHRLNSGLNITVKGKYRIGGHVKVEGIIPFVVIFEFEAGQNYGIRKFVRMINKKGIKLIIPEGSAIK